METTQLKVNSKVWVASTMDEKKATVAIHLEGLENYEIEDLTFDQTKGLKSVFLTLKKKGRVK